MTNMNEICLANAGVFVIIILVSMPYDKISLY